jgi:NADPH-dependent glutamate synthase beta subunit-like oxidoreductase
LLNKSGPKGGFSAVVLAIGAHKSRHLGVPGEDLPGVYHGTQFLKDVAMGKIPDMKGKTVAVVGGGAVAIDAARTALRLGAKKVHIIYRRTREEMPAWKAEVDAAFHEGVQFHFLTDPVGVLGPEHVTGVECHLGKLAEFDSSGRRRPVPIEITEFEGAEFVLDADMFIPAIGQTPEAECLGDGGTTIGLSRQGTVVVGANLATSREGVFAAGDLALGPATVIEAVAQGNKAAVAVDAYLKGQSVERPKFTTEFREIPQLYNIENYAEAKRPAMRELPVNERIRNFEEVEGGFDEQKAREECKRCLRCDLEWLESMGLLSESKKVA